MFEFLRHGFEPSKQTDKTGTHHAGLLWEILEELADKQKANVVYLGAGLTPDHPDSRISSFSLGWIKELIRRSRHAGEPNTPIYPRVYYHDLYTPSEFLPTNDSSYMTKDHESNSMIELIQTLEPGKWINEIVTRIPSHVAYMSVLSQVNLTRSLAAVTPKPKRVSGYPPSRSQDDEDHEQGKDKSYPHSRRDRTDYKSGDRYNYKYF
jgi:hypothetical protein